MCKLLKIKTLNFKTGALCIYFGLCSAINIFCVLTFLIFQVWNYSISLKIMLNVVVV